jgi:hypothetical protein
MTLKTHWKHRVLRLFISRYFAHSDQPLFSFSI